jgi:kumamolisin
MEDNKYNSVNVPKGHQRLEGAGRPRAAGAKLLGPLNADEQVGVTLLLRDKPGSPPLPDYEHWKKTPPGQRRFLSVQEHIDTYGATQEDLDAVTTYLKSHGLTITEASSGRCSVVAHGTAAQINAAFGVQLNRYEAPLPVNRRRLPKNAKETPTAPATHTYHGFDGSVYLPAELIGIVKAVIGLDNRSLGGHSGTGDPSGAAAVSVPYLASLYNFPNLSASDQTIGVLSGGGSYLASDIQDSYFPSLPPASPPSLPVGYNNPPTLVPISLTYGGQTYSNNPSEISSGSASGADYEVTQDISTSSTIAQGATVNVYFADGTGTEQGWVTFLNRLLVPDSETQPSVVTSSFFITRQDDPATIGDPATTGPQRTPSPDCFRK